MIAVVVHILSLIRELVKAGFIRKDPPIARTVIAHARIYPILNQMLNETGACRVAMLKTTNGGGIPKPGSTLRSSVIAEVYGKDAEAVACSWQEQLVDADYVKMLSRLVMAGRTFVITSELDEDSMLGQLYQSMGIVFSKVMLIETLPEMMIYVSLNFTTGEPASITPDQREAARAGANQLAQVFERSRK